MSNKNKPQKSNNSNNNPPKTNTPPIISEDGVNQSNPKIEVAESSKSDKDNSLKEDKTSTPKAKKIRWFENSKGWGNFFSFLVVLITVVSGFIVKSHFEITNKPNLQFNSFKIDTFIVNQPIIYHYELANTGNYPVKLVNTRFTVVIRKVVPNYKDVLEDFKNEGLENPNTIVSKEFPLNRTQINYKPVKVGQSLAVFKFGYYVFFTGFFEYENLSNNKKYQYRFQIQTTPYWDKNGFNFIVNENIEIE